MSVYLLGLLNTDNLAACPWTTKLNLCLLKTRASITFANISMGDWPNFSRPLYVILLFGHLWVVLTMASSC